MVKTRAELAQELLDNPLFTETFDKIKDDIIERWKVSPTANEKEREKLWWLYKLIQKYELKIQRYIEDARFNEIREKQKKDTGENPFELY